MSAATTETHWTPWASRYFALGLGAYFATKVKTQREVCKDLGIRPATMSSYVTGNRGKGASEDTLRAISRHIGWVYEDLLCFGRLVYEGYSAPQWKRTPDIPSKDHKYQTWMRVSPTAETKDDLLLIPLPEYTKEEGYSIIKTKLHIWVPELDFIMFPMFTDGAAIKDKATSTAKSEDSVAFSKSWAKSKGIVDPDSCYCFKGIDNAMSTPVTESATLLICASKEHQAIIEGRVYAIWDEGGNKLVCRRLARRNGKIHVYNDSPLIYPPYDIDEAELHIFGQVIWTGVEV